MQRRGGLLFAFVIALATLALPATSEAAIRDINCNDEPNDISAIQNAVNEAHNGDTIRLAGTCNFSPAEAAGGDHASISNAGVVIRPGTPIDGLTIQPAGNPQSASIVGSGTENAFFVAPGNSNVRIRGLRFENLGRPVVAVNTSGTLIGDATDGTTPEAWGNRIFGVHGTSSAILGIGRDRGFGNPAGTLIVHYGDNAGSTATFTIPAGQKLQNFSAVGNFITYSNPGLDPGDANDIVAIDIRQADGGEIQSVDIMRNATAFLTDDIQSFAWNAVRVQAHANTAEYHINDVDVIQNNFGMLEELPQPSNDPNKAGRVGVLLARVNKFNISSNKVRAIMAAVLQPAPGGGIVTTDSSNGEVAHNTVIVIAHPTTPISSDLGAYGVVDNLFGTGAPGTSPPSEHIVLHDNIVGPTIGPPGLGGLHGFVVTGSTDITARGNNVRSSGHRALEVAGRVLGLVGDLPKPVFGSGFCGNLLDGDFDLPAEVGFEEDGLAGSSSNSLPDGSSVFGNGSCVGAAVIVLISGADTQVCEGGLTDTYTIRLSLRPVGTVTVKLNGDSQTTTSSPSIVFNYANWNTPQVVTVSAIDDAVFEGTHGGVVTHTASSTDPIFANLVIINVNVTICDNDIPPPTPLKRIIVTESLGSTDVTEGGATDTYTIVLSAPPSSPRVQVNIFPDSQEGVSPTSVTFTPANWNVPQTILVAAVNDLVFEGNHNGFIQHASFGFGDPAYEAATINGVVVHITDNDVPDVTPPGPPTITGSCPATTTSRSLTLSGGAEPNSLVTIFLNGVPVASTTATGGGFWSATITFTANGTYFITVTARDAAGNQSSPSSVCTIVVNADFAPPNAPVILVPLEGAIVGVPTTISGTSDPDSVIVEVREPGTETGILLGSSSGTTGTWSISANLAEGAHAVRARAFDSAGNVSPWSNLRNFFIDRTPPTITITRPPLYLGFQVFPLGSGTLRGTARDNAGLSPGFISEVRVTYTNILTGQAITENATCIPSCGLSSINWEHQPSLGIGVFTVRAVAYDRVGLASAAATELVIAAAQ
jgi:Big-like domain-containing protein